MDESSFQPPAGTFPTRPPVAAKVSFKRSVKGARLSPQIVDFRTVSLWGLRNVYMCWVCVCIICWEYMRVRLSQEIRARRRCPDECKGALWIIVGPKFNGIICLQKGWLTWRLQGWLNFYTILLSPGWTFVSFSRDFACLHI